MMNNKTITIVSVTGSDLYTQGSAYAISRSYLEMQKKIPKEQLCCLLISPQKPDHCPDFIKWIECKPFSYLEYNYFIIYMLHHFIHTDFALIVQNDGFVLNGENWQDAFLDYDYIGAPLNTLYSTQDGFLTQTGQSFWETHFDRIPEGYFEAQNGGFSLRSKHLLTLPTQLRLKWSVDLPILSEQQPLTMEPNNTLHNEDMFFNTLHRSLFEGFGIKYAPSSLAMAFATESTLYHKKHNFDMRRVFGTHTIGHFVLNNINNAYMQKPIDIVNNNILSNSLAYLLLVNNVSITIPQTIMDKMNEKNRSNH